MIEFRQKTYSKLNAVGNQVLGFGKIVKGLAKDRGYGKMIAGNLAAGAVGAGISYGVDKFLYNDSKKSGMLPNESQEVDKKTRLKKGLIAGGTLATAGTLALGAHKGWLPKKISKPINTATGYLKGAAINQTPKGI